MNSERIKECTLLSAEILKNFELAEIPVCNIILKCLRLCRLLDDEDGILLFTYESSGYPSTSGGLTPDAWRIAKIAGRRYYQREKSKSGKQVDNEYATTTLIAELEEMISSQKLRLSASVDPNISLSSANPTQLVMAPPGNSNERNAIVSSIRNAQKTLQIVTGCLYNYVLHIYNKLSYGNVIEDTFTQARLEVNDLLSKLCPQAIGKFVTVYNNMDSDNEEDWANAVHSCRRILVDLADALYPPREDHIEVSGKTIKVGPSQYINRLVQFVDSKSESKTFASVVGSDLASIGNRLDAINEAVCKGIHSEISKKEASRYIIHTYFLISDIVSLID